MISKSDTPHINPPAPLSAPPAPPRRPHTWNRPTGPVDDPFAWMRDVEDPEFLGYLRDENTHSDQFFEAHTESIETIFGEIKSRVQETDMSMPVRNGPWWYVSRTQECRSCS